MQEFSVSSSRQADAARRLEELNIASAEIVRLLRAGQSDRFAYALVYVLRKQLGYIVRTLGEEVPVAEMQNKAIEVIDAEIWKEIPNRST